jgi:hypothetical protein
MGRAKAGRRWEGACARAHHCSGSPYARVGSLAGRHVARPPKAGRTSPSLSLAVGSTPHACRSVVPPLPTFPAPCYPALRGRRSGPVRRYRSFAGGPSGLRLALAFGPCCPVPLSPPVTGLRRGLCLPHHRRSGPRAVSARWGILGIGRMADSRHGPRLRAGNGQALGRGPGGVLSWGAPPVRPRLSAVSLASRPLVVRALGPHGPGRTRHRCTDS